GRRCRWSGCLGPVCPWCARGRRRSVAVGASAGQHAEHVDGELLVVESQQYAPVGDAEAPLAASSQLDDVAGGRVGDETVQRVEDALAYRRIETAQVASRGWRDLDAPAGGQSNSRRNSSSGTEAPRCAQASSTLACSSGVRGSSSSGALLKNS